MSDTLPTPELEPDYRVAFNHLCDALLDEAMNRDWCDQYDSFVQGVNTQLPHGIDIPERHRSYQVHFACEMSTIAIGRLESAIDEVLRNTFETSSCTGFDYEIA